MSRYLNFSNNGVGIAVSPSSIWAGLGARCSRWLGRGVLGTPTSTP